MNGAPGATPAEAERAAADLAAWEAFLRRTPAGQFQQAAGWARAKQSEGWQCARVVRTADGSVTGGCQLLWRHTRIGRVGYVSKGPVIAEPGGGREAALLTDLLALARNCRLTALVIQPPDHQPHWGELLRPRGFAPNRITKVIDASLSADLTGPPGAWEARLRSDRRREARLARERGCAIRTGGPGDAAEFFALMCQTCARQGVPPNPSTATAFAALVAGFAPAGEARLAFATCGGETVAAGFTLRFGARSTFCKRAWNGAHAAAKPNVLITHDLMAAAAAQGCTEFDFAGVERALAENLLAGRPPTPAQLRHYDTAKLGFGGQPRLLPPAWIYFRQPWWRFAYRHAVARPWLAARLQALARGV